MKIKPQHLEHLRIEIKKTLDQTPGIIAKYENGVFYNSKKVKDLQTRFCFDLLYMTSGLNNWVCDELHKYGIQGNHLLTALKKVTPKLVRKY